MVHREREAEGTSERVEADAIPRITTTKWPRNRFGHWVPLIKDGSVQQLELSELPTTEGNIPAIGDGQNRSDGSTWPEWL